MIKALDDAVGAIHQKVKDVGLEEETMIVFISDNGGASYTGATTNGTLKGGKLSQFEGGLNVPFMMKWKNVIPENTIYEDPVSALDLYPTIANVAKAKVPKDRVIDGVNLLPFILDEARVEQPHDVLYWRADHIWAIRKGDYKLIDELFQLLKNPYSEQLESEKWFAKRPEWARNKVGCSMLSCSS